MHNQITAISCQTPNCPRKSLRLETSTSGEKFLLVKFRHHTENHEQKLSLDDLIKKEYTPERIAELLGK